MSRAPSDVASQHEREAFFEQAQELTPFVGVGTGEGVFLVRTDDRHIGRSLFAKRGRGEMQVLTRAVNTVEALYGSDAVEGTSFIDVGANIGTTTVPALLHHGFSHALAIEPEDDNFVTLRANAVLNGLDKRIVTVRKAVSNQTGTAELVVKHGQGGKHWIATGSDKKARVRVEDEIVCVETVTLDQLATEELFDPDRTGLLWIDAQAHEGHIIEGAGCLTSRGVPIVLEWDPQALDRVGDRGKLQEVAARNYSHFTNMRSDAADDGPKFWLRPVDELDEYAERFLDPSTPEKFTDIMLVRLEGNEVPGEGEAEQVDLASLVKRYVRRRDA
jgi:FkbM family methyltransferase